MTRAVLGALLSHWRRAPLQALTLILGLALATGLWSGVQAINAEARASYTAAAATLGEGRFDQLVAREGEGVAQSTYITLRRAGWQVSPVLEGRLPVAQGSLRLVGLDPFTLPGRLSPIALDNAPRLEDFLSRRVVFANAATAERLPTSDWQVVVDASVAPGTLLADIGTVQRMLDQPERLSRLILHPVQPRGVPPLGAIAPELVRRAGQTGNDIAALTDSFHLNLTAFGLLSFAVGLFIVHGAVGLTFESRRALVRSLRALGVPIRRLVALMLAELLGLALVAGVLGIALGYLVAGLLLPDVAATLEGLYGASVSGGLVLRPVWWLSGLAMALAGTLAASGVALWRIARMPPLASARPRAWVMAAGKTQVLQGVGGVGLLALALGLALWGRGLIAGFALLAGLMLGAALLLPLVLSPLLKLGQTLSRSALAQWFWADSRQQVPGLSLALMALLLAMATNIGVGTMVSSFRETFTGFIEQRLLADLYVTAETAEQAALVERFASDSAQVLPIVSVEHLLDGQPGQLYGARLGPVYAENWHLLVALPDAWERAAKGQGVIINEQLARRQELWPGAVLTLLPGVELEIVGVIGDYGNPEAQAIIAEPLFQQHFPAAQVLQLGLVSDTPEALRRALVDEVGLSASQVTERARVKAISLEIFERTFAVTGALNVLTLAVAGFAMLMSLLTLAALRLPQLAPVWALGLTQRRLGLLEVLRACILALLTAFCAVPLGLGLAWVLLSVVNVEAFGWKLPMSLFPRDYAQMVGFAAFAALLAAGWPAWRLSRTPPSALLKVFAHER